jgi:capsule polysaccharide export protein KpsC/LpsZ
MQLAKLQKKNENRKFLFSIANLKWKNRIFPPFFKVSNPIYIHVNEKINSLIKLFKK